LEPGYYDDAAALSQLTTGGPCAGKVVWLKPGIYYFDFEFNAPPGTCTAEPDRCTWRIDDPDLDVVGGTRTWNDMATRPDVKIPGGCRTGEDGVQLIFGGQSRMHQTAGETELCPYRKSKLAPPIPVYGMAQGTAAERVQSYPATTSLPPVNFSNPTNAYEIDEQPTRLTADATAPLLATSASITVGGFEPDVPEGSLLASATVLIEHRETGLGGTQTATVVNGQGQVLATQVLPSCAAFCLARIDLPDITPDKLQGIRVTYAVTLTGLLSPKEALDGIELEVRFTPPSFRALSDCLTADAGCALIKAEGGSKLVLNGTVYAPTATLDLARNDLSTPMVNDGVIAGTLRLTIKPACFAGPAISHLDAQFPSDVREDGAVFTACIAGTPVLRARVTFTGTPARAKVESWSVLR